MRPSISLVLCNFMLIIASRAQGIRLEGESLAAFRIGEKNNLLMGAPGNEGVAVLRADGSHFSGSRKLMNRAAPTPNISVLHQDQATSSRFHGHPQKVKTNKKDNSSVDTNSSDMISMRPPISDRAPSPPETIDIVDIAGMDYSPAKKKPPIHN